MDERKLTIELVTGERLADLFPSKRRVPADLIFIMLLIVASATIASLVSYRMGFDSGYRLSHASRVNCESEGAFWVNGACSLQARPLQLPELPLPVSPDNH